MGINELSIEEFGQKLRAGEVTSEAVTKAVLDAIDADQTNAFYHQA